MADTSSQQSTLRQFLASLATIKGDLSNITAPPFVLADKSTTEFPRFWVEHPDLFCAPAQEPDPARRILAVLKWWLSCQKAQNYAEREPNEGIKKPLNAFLGEVFTGECGPEDEPTKLVSEQVSHHPPVTACYLWNEKHGIRAEGFTRQEITFNGSVNIRQIGRAVLHLDVFDEDYLIPLPNIRVKGVLTGSPYPELTESYSIVSSSGFVAEVDFSGKGLLGLTGKKNHFETTVYHGSNKKEVLFSGEGGWSESFVFKDGSGKEIDAYDVSKTPAMEFRTASLDVQDPWESRRAWAGVIDGVHAGNMQAVADCKHSLEEAQRELRKRPETSEDAWVPLFFHKERTHATAKKLLAMLESSHGGRPQDNNSESWAFDLDKATSVRRPWRGDLTPSG